MTLPIYEGSEHIERIGQEQAEQFSKFGESIVRVSLGVENIKNTQRLIARDSAFLERYRTKEVVKPETGNLFAVVFTEPKEHTFHSKYHIDNSVPTRSFPEQYSLMVEPYEDDISLFLATSFQPYALESHGTLLNGYQFNGLAGTKLQLDPNIETGSVDGVEIGQVNMHYALDLMHGGATMVASGRQLIKNQREELSQLIDRHDVWLAESR